MRSMEIDFGLVRDKQRIYSGLTSSQSQKRQLAVCFNSDGKLVVKIAVVSKIEHCNDGTWVTLLSPDDNSETRLLLDHVQSIYPIRDFAS